MADVLESTELKEVPQKESSSTNTFFFLLFSSTPFLAFFTDRFGNITNTKKIYDFVYFFEFL